MELEPSIHLEPRAQGEPFPYTYSMSGAPTRPLPTWEALFDLLHLLGLHREYYYLVVDRTDGVERWAQVIGHPEAMAVELGLPDEPKRVHRTAGDQSGRMLTTAIETHVEARASELFTAAEAHVLIRAWLERGMLGIDGTALRTPDDWARMYPDTAD